MVRAREALDRYGNAKAIVLARVIPVVGTVLNPLAGTVGVPASTFTVWQVAGRLDLVGRRHPRQLRVRLADPQTSTTTCCP